MQLQKEKSSYFEKKILYEELNDLLIDYQYGDDSRAPRSESENKVALDLHSYRLDLRSVELRDESRRSETASYIIS